MIEETLRLHPTATFFGKLTGEDLVTSNYRIPKDTEILVYAIYNYYVDPLSWYMFSSHRIFRIVIQNTLKIHYNSIKVGLKLDRKSILRQDIYMSSLYNKSIHFVDPVLMCTCLLGSVTDHALDALLQW